MVITEIWLQNISLNFGLYLPGKNDVDLERVDRINQAIIAFQFVANDANGFDYNLVFLIKKCWKLWDRISSSVTRSTKLRSPPLRGYVHLLSLKSTCVV